MAPPAGKKFELQQCQVNVKTEGQNSTGPSIKRHRLKGALSQSNIFIITFLHRITTALYTTVINIPEPQSGTTKRNTKYKVRQQKTPQCAAGQEAVWLLNVSVAKAPEKSTFLWDLGPKEGMEKASARSHICNPLCLPPNTPNLAQKSKTIWSLKKFWNLIFQWSRELWLKATCYINRTTVHCITTSPL